MTSWSFVVPQRDVGRGSPERVFAAPHPALAGRVLTYAGHQIPATDATPWRMMPLGAVLLMLDLDPSGSRRADPAVTDLAVSPVLGLRDRPLTLVQNGATTGIAVALPPLGAHALFGGAVGELANSGVAVTDLLGADARVLVERLAETRGWPARFALLDEFLTARPPSRRVPDAEVGEAWRRLWATPNVRIGDLARELGWSRQRLHTRFRAQIGLGPKAVARTARLHHAVRLLDARQHPLAEVADRSGYADQSHLHRDFRTLTGVTPTEYVVA